jgi:hypothetical protein
MSAIMQDDVKEGLELRDVEFTGRAVITDGGSILYLETKITDDDGYVTWNWIAHTDKAGLIFSDEQPAEGLHIAKFSV